MNSIRQCLQRVFDSLESGQEFDGIWLKDRVAQMDERYMYTYPDTVMRIARMYFRNQYRCVKRSRSRYAKV